jgi:hypothetical protein
VTKRLVTVFALAAVFVGLLFYVKYYEAGPTSSERAEDAKKPTMFEAKTDRFQQVELSGAGGGIVMVKAPNGLWRMKSPFDTRGDMIAMEAIINTLTKFKAESKVAGKNPNPKDFGFSNPQLRVATTLKGGENVSFTIGGQTPIGDNCYVMRAGDPAVYIVSATNINPFKKTVVELRDRSVADNYGRSEVKSVSVLAGGRETVCDRRLANTGGNSEKDKKETASAKNIKKEMNKPEWYFEGRETVDCEEAADSILSELDFTEAKLFVDKTGGNLADYGLDKPRFVMEVQFKKRVPIRFEIGGETGGGIYARNANRNEIYVIEPSLLQKFDEFRRAASKI